MIHDDCQLGAGTQVYPYASVVRGSELGDHCVIGPCALVDGSRLGHNCRVGHAASLNPGTWIGDNVFIGPGVITCNDLYPEVGKLGFDLSGWTVVVEDNASIGAGAILLPGARIAAGAMVAAGASVSGLVMTGTIYQRDGTARALPADRHQRRMRFAHNSNHALAAES